MGQVSAITLHYILKVLNKHYKIDTAELLTNIGVDSNIFNEENSYVDSSKLKLLFHKAVELCDDPCLPLHLGKFSSPESIGLLGYMLSNTATVGEMLEKMCYFSNLIGKNLQFTLTQIKSGYKISLHMHNNPLMLLPRYQSEIHLSAIISLIRKLSGINIVPQEAYFQHSTVETIEEYEKFFGKILHFNAHENALLLSNEELNVPLKSPYPGLLKYFESQAEKIIENLYNDNWHTRVKKMILIKIGNEDIDIKAIASALDISTRMLQKHLKNEGFIYAKLLEGVRKKLAKYYLSNFSIDIATIAIYIGYSDVSSFSRSFKIWFDISPQLYRKNIPYNKGHAAISSNN